MKKGLYALIALVVAVGLIWIGWAMAKHGSLSKSSSSLTTTNPHSLQVGHTGLMDLSEWQEFHAARETALQTNPELAAGYKELIQGMQDQQNKLDAAMIKADPSVSPIIAKLVLLRQRNGAPVGSASAPAHLSHPGGNSVNLTPDEWQKLRSARATALQTNPDLTAASQRMNDNIRAYQDKLNAAMIKVDPKVATIVTKIEASHPRLAGTVIPGSAK